MPELQPCMAFVPSLEPQGLSLRDRAVRGSQSNHLEEMLSWPEKPGKALKTQGAVGALVGRTEEGKEAQCWLQERERVQDDQAIIVRCRPPPSLS